MPTNWLDPIFVVGGDEIRTWWRNLEDCTLRQWLLLPAPFASALVYSVPMSMKMKMSSLKIFFKCGIISVI